MVTQVNEKLQACQPDNLRIYNDGERGRGLAGLDQVEARMRSLFPNHPQVVVGGGLGKEQRC